MPKKSRMILILIATLFLAMFFLPQFISLYIDWLWFKDVGFGQVFTTKINAQAMTAFAGMLAGFIVTYANLWFSMNATKGRSVVMASFSQAIPQLDILRHFDKVKIILPVIIGLFAGLLLNSSWLTFLYYFNGAASGFSDPIFGKDISFYLFTLPVHEIISAVVLVILGISFVVSALNYILKGAILLNPKGIVSCRK